MIDSPGSRRLPRLRPRNPETHKGDYGRLLVVAGSRGLSGAAGLTGLGALRSGAGLVTIGSPSSVEPLVATSLLEVMTSPLPETDSATLGSGAVAVVQELATRCDVVALGPGLSLHPETIDCIRELLLVLDVPVVLDADGLNAVVGALEILDQREAPTILTPHPGEMRRLLEGKEPGLDLARRFAGEHGVHVVLKGHRTLVTDGEDVYRNTTGNPGMATAGSGDVLTGVVAAMLGQGLSPFDAAVIAVYLHGRAGDLAAEALGESGILASDIALYLPHSIEEFVLSDRDRGCTEEEGVNGG